MVTDVVSVSEVAEGFPENRIFRGIKPRPKQSPSARRDTELRLVWPGYLSNKS